MMMTDDTIKHQHIRVELDMYDLARCHSEAEAQFVVRMKLKQAGIPIGPWGTSTVEHGILWWWDDWHVRVVEWRDTDAADQGCGGEEMTRSTEKLIHAALRDGCREHCDALIDELRRLSAELERERMRLAACGVVALADTPDSAKHARQMHPDYESAACQDVARRVDECISLRAQRDQLLEACKTLVNLPGTEDWIATLRLAVEQARAAIKAAEGENT